MHFIATLAVDTVSHSDVQIVSQNSDCLLFLQDDLLLFVNEIAVRDLSVLKILRLIDSFQFLSAKRRLKFVQKVHELVGFDPACRLRVKILPKLDEVIDIISAHNAEVLCASRI